MVKEVGETVKAFLDFIRSPKIVTIVFLASGVWLVPRVRAFFPLPDKTVITISSVASILFIVTAGALLVEIFVWGWTSVKKKRQKGAEARRLRKAIREATATEKAVLQALVHLGRWYVGLDVGSPMAMHLQQIGLIERARGLPTTQYAMVRGLMDLCLKEQLLLSLSEDEGKAVQAEIEEWHRMGRHRGFIYQISERVNRNDWMN